MSIPTVAIVGRSNVGKSTLFNRITGGRKAIVHDRPGVTRDRNFTKADWAGREFWLVDTGGWIPGRDDAISAGIRQQVDLAIAAADVVMFVVDTQQGVHAADEEVAEVLRPVGDRVLLVANKADDLPDDMSYHEFHRLGLGAPIPVSAAIGKASGDLLDKLIARFPEDSARQEDDAIGVAVIGRPNVGKSSLVNKLLGEERTLVAPEAGTTRDAIDSQLKYHGAALNFIDTAGLRKKPKVKDDIEFYSRVRTERALDRTGVALLVIDATCGMEGQDLRIAEDVWSRGCGLIVAVNKWDLLEEKDSDTAIRGQRDIAERVQFMDAVPFAYVSALTGQRVRKLLDLIVEVAEQRSRRIPTAEVNRVLEALLARNQPPQKPGKKVNILYGSQVAVDPPTFALVSNRPDVIPESYVRYLNNGFRKAWGFAGSPIRIRLRRKRKRESA